MKRFLLLLIATLLMPFALAATSMDFTVSPGQTVSANQQFTITLKAHDAQGLDSIFYKLPSGDRKLALCGGQVDCTATLDGNQANAGSYVYTFYAVPAGNYQGATTSVPITVQGGSSSGAQPANPQTTTSYTAQGAGADTNPGTITISLVGTPAVGQAFTLNIVGQDNDGLDSIRYYNAGTQNYEMLKLCGGQKDCSTSKIFTETLPGMHTYKFVMWDASGHDKISTYDVNVGTGSGTTTTQSTGGSSSGGSATTIGPITSFKTDPLKPCAGSVTIFDASASSPRSGKITSYEWNFGDGSSMTTADPKITHTYTSSGTYDIVLFVTDASGSNPTYRSLNVQNAGSCVAAPLATGSGLSEFGTIIVTINDGKPVDGANVQLVPTDNPLGESHATTTNSNGVATFEQVQPGCYDVVANKDTKNFDKANVCVHAGEVQQATIGIKSASVGGPISWIWVLTAVILIAVVGGGVYYYTNQDQTKQEQKFKPKSGSTPILPTNQQVKFDKHP